MADADGGRKNTEKTINGRMIEVGSFLCRTLSGACDFGLMGEQIGENEGGTDREKAG